jgi:hypothetical protein
VKPALRDALSRALAASRAARATLADLDTALEAALEEGLQAPVEEATASARRAHRPGVISKLSTDPDLRAFVLARIDGLTFDQIADDIAANFPPERCVSRSSLHRWWHRHGRHLEPLNRL